MDMKRCALLMAAVSCLSQPVAAQEPTATSVRPLQPTIRMLWEVDFGYPIRASTGVTLVVGRGRRLTGYESQLRGLVAGVDAGPAGVSAKVGWAILRPYDAGTSGYSAEVMFVRPLGITSRFDRHVSYVGPGVSYYLFCFRLSGAALFATESARRGVVPVATAALVVPLWQ